MSFLVQTIRIEAEKLSCEWEDVLHEAQVIWSRDIRKHCSNVMLIPK